MMKQLLENLELVIMREKSLADKDHGPIKSRHEGYGVLAEEYYEALNELRPLYTNFELLSGRFDKPDLYTTSIRNIRECALYSASELIQVTAVCDRILEMEGKKNA